MIIEVAVSVYGIVHPDDVVDSRPSVVFIKTLLVDASIEF
jgi:hypothetical protein